MTFSDIKITLLQTVIEHKVAAVTAAASPIVGLLLEFARRRWPSDAVLIIIVFLAVGINIIVGVIKAKKTVDNNGKSLYDPKILRDKTKLKMVAYLLWLLLTYLVMIAVKIGAYLDDDTGNVVVATPKLLLHYPITATYLFFILVEALSIQKNLKSMGAKIPGFSTDAIKKILPDMNEKDLDDEDKPENV